MANKRSDASEPGEVWRVEHFFCPECQPDFEVPDTPIYEDELIETGP